MSSLLLCFSKRNRSFWCQLCDSTGNPYNGTEATIVTCSACACVDDIRDAVKAKYQSNHLKDVCSLNLRVYKSKAAFDMRNDSEAKESHLSPDFLLTNRNLGRSMEDALVVVVDPSKRRNELRRLEAKCTRYLNSIASRISEFYCFDHEDLSPSDYEFYYPDRKDFDSPTIDDFLEAKNGKEGVDWHIRRSTAEYNLDLADGTWHKVFIGDPVVRTKLPDIFRADEWERLAKYNMDILKNIDDEIYLREMMVFLNNCDTKAFAIPNEVKWLY
jgi:hypothetical protein